MAQAQAESAEPAAAPRAPAGGVVGGLVAGVAAALGLVAVVGVVAVVLPKRDQPEAALASDPAESTATVAPASVIEVEPQVAAPITPEPDAIAGAAPENVPQIVSAPVPEAPTQALADPAAAPAASSEAAPAPLFVAAGEAPPVPRPVVSEVVAAPAPPRFDTLRAAPDGSVLLAGRAQAGAGVEVLIDGVAVALAEADAQGQFVAQFDLPGADVPRSVALRMLSDAGAPVVSDETLILAPAAGTGTATQAVAPEVLLADAQGGRVLDPAPGRLVIDTMGQSLVGQSLGGQSAGGQGAGPVRVTGRGAGQGHVRAYLDNALLAEAPVDEAGNWALDLPAPALAPGAHALRIDAIDASGQVRARAETTLQDLSEVAVATGSPQTMVPPPDAGQVRAQVVTVERGYTLWAIALKNYGDGLLYVRIFEANKDQIRDPDMIYPGQVFAIPQ